ncbi:MAG: hypothetical protein RLZZ200_2249 [Pseudomonadota bacterium]
MLDAVEEAGFRTDGRLFALNSYENRVYRVGVEPGETDTFSADIVPDQCVVKFYRPGRWTDAQLLEEQAFGLELAAADLPVAAPLRRDGETLFHRMGFRFAVFECRRGGAPEFDLPGARELLGRTLGRLHAIGARAAFKHRERLSQADCGERSRAAVMRAGLLPRSLESRYRDVSGELVEAVRGRFESLGPLRSLRLHGDCHPGNLLWNARGPVFVDLDDCLQGPAVQDLWMLGDAGWQGLLEGYRQFAHFDDDELLLVEALRAMRMLHHSAWIAGRWEDPAFPRAFPGFGTPRYWEDLLVELAAQCDAVQDPARRPAW